MDSKQDLLSNIRALPLLWLSLAFLAGILLANGASLLAWQWLALSGGAALLGILLHRRLGWLPIGSLALLAAMAFGAARLQAALPQFTAGELAWYNDSPDWVEVSGSLARPPVAHDRYVELVVQAEQLILTQGEPQPVSGLLLVEADFGEAWRYGDRIVLHGRLLTPPSEEDFSYRDYLARQGVYSLMAFPYTGRLEGNQGNPILAGVYALRQRGVDVLQGIYPSQESALLAGILLGDESHLSAALKDDFNLAGTRHIIAISGFNITILAGLFLAAFSRWLGQRRGAWLAGAAIVLYTLLVGGDPPVVRAAIMGLVGLLALQTGRQQLALNSLALAAAFTAMFNPLVLWDVGFQLSFAATLGIIFFAERLSAWAHNQLQTRLSPQAAKRLRGPLNEYVFMTLAAQVTTLPILLLYFQRVSLLSLPANLLVLPVQPALMVLGGISLLLGLVWMPLGQLVGFFAGWLATYTIRITQLFAGFPGAVLSASLSLGLVIAYYVILGLLLLRPWWPQWRKLRLLPAVGLAVAGALCLWVWSAALAAPDGRLSLTLLDVDGEALLLRSPTGRLMLIDTGPSRAALADELRQEVPIGQELDWLLLAGRRQDQIGALQAGLLDPAARQVAFSPGIELPGEPGSAHMLVPGDHFELGGGAALDVVATGERGALLLLSLGDFRALLPLGVDFDLLEQLDNGQPIGSVSLLLLADGGYVPLNPPEWFANLSPQQIWVAGQPPEELADVLAGYSVLAGAETGWLRVSTDGRSMWFEAGG